MPYGIIKVDIFNYKLVKAQRTPQDKGWNFMCTKLKVYIIMSEEFGEPQNEIKDNMW